MTNIVNPSRFNIQSRNQEMDPSQIVSQFSTMNKRIQEIDEHLIATKHEHDKLVDRVSDLQTEMTTNFNEIKRLLTGSQNTANTTVQNRSVLGTDESFFPRPSHLDSFIQNTEVQRSSTSLAKPHPLPIFDGRPEEAASWLTKYEMACALNFWKDAEMLRGVGGCVTGIAERWFLGRYMAKMANANEKSWSHFRTEFCKMFFRKGDRFRLLKKILSHNQKPGERLSTFFLNVIALCNDYDPTMGEDDIITHFLRGMKP